VKLIREPFLLQGNGLFDQQTLREQETQEIEKPKSRSARTKLSF
jgi:hypothetical protein